MTFVWRRKKISGFGLQIEARIFPQSFIHNLNRKLQVKGRAEVEKVGKVTYRAKKKTYHCYQVRLFENQEIKNLSCVNAYQLVNMPMDDFDKEILFRMIIGEYFTLDK